MTRSSSIVGVGATPYYQRGATVARTTMDLLIEAIRNAVDDAGLQLADIDGFALYSGGYDTALLAQTLGLRELRFSAAITGTGGGSAGAVGLAGMAVDSGAAEVVVTAIAVQQRRRMGAAFSPSGGSGPYAGTPTAESDFSVPSGLLSPGQSFAMLAQRHMHVYGTTREHFASVAITTRRHAQTRQSALMRDELTLESYLASRMIADPLCLYDFCLESEGAVAVVTTTDRRARDLAHRPVRILASAHGGTGSWGKALTWMNMPADSFVTSGHQSLAQRLWRESGLSASDVDVALLYDHFTPMVLMQLEDYGFCGPGEGGPYMADGGGAIDGNGTPVNPHGGNLSEAYILGMTHVREAVEQLRGSAVNQVDGAEVALVTGGPAPLPSSNLLLGVER
ncbi:thiolase [Streptomyces sp. AS58]|uniref:thiolase C-terminal domain-containing protein n=1 Tax=Streptomyces sp. AS58 TaxID=1519489 RepID=UPI0006AE4705|nr:thiolase [Streptomyces sp. AS58]KOV53277.1 thiolase [Streptomyces sp. AS58]